MHGLLVVDKPVGPTSHDVVARVRRAIGERRVGHTGTLDPGASGVLPLVLGRATRLARFLSAAEKSYDATIVLGAATDTYDSAGRRLTASNHGPLPERDLIERTLDAFRGTFLQEPPPFSAKKIGGRRSYDLARAAAAAPGAEDSAPAPRPAPVTVTVHRLQIVGLHADRLVLRLDCSPGFYVRSLAHDLGRRLGTGAHLEALRRTRSGDLSLADAVPLDVIERDPGAAAAAIVPLGRMLPAMPSVRLTAAGVTRARHGRELEGADYGDAPAGLQPGAGDRPVRLLDPTGDLVGLAVPGTRPGLLHPSVVLV
jgi:tRNA pseudouridine55 synthase